MNEKHSFFAELKRRNVYKVAVAYIVGGWALSQGIAQVLPVFDIPNWIVRVLVILIVAGFPIALVIAWAFEATPEGIKRTAVADAASERSRGKVWIYVVIAGALLSIGLFFLGATPLETQHLDTMPVRLGPRRLQRRKNRSPSCRWLTKAGVQPMNIFRTACRRN